jgi:subtilisin family serine protease
VISEIWHNATYRTALDESLKAIKVDAARQKQNLTGKGVVWAVVDTGILGTHPGFGNRVKQRLDLSGKKKKNPDDIDGHGTHVAGIIGGYLDPKALAPYPNQQTDDAGNPVSPLSGVAPEIELVSLKVIEKDGDNNNTSPIVKALELIELGHVQVHGVNVSLQNDADENHWCSGDCPVCKLIGKISEQGIVVCAAAGNLDSLRTIVCPGRSSEAITVGACHKFDASTYGIHYKSAGGPTPDGRAKPDVVAPGVDILSYSIKFASSGPLYTQKTGTSMATAFVSGLCGLLVQDRLAAQRNSAGKTLKEILTKSAVDLHRMPELQGTGLISATDALAESRLVK